MVAFEDILLVSHGQIGWNKNYKFSMLTKCSNVNQILVELNKETHAYSDHVIGCTVTSYWAYNVH